MALLLHKHLPPTRSGRTFFVALALLGLGALAQFVGLGIYLWRGGIAARRAAAPTIAPSLHFSAPLPELLPSDSSAPPAPTPAPAAAANPAPVPAAPAPGLPTPAASALYPAPSVDLIEQARQLRLRGDTSTALARLRQAQNAEPDNAQIIAEMALTFEAMQAPDRAAEQWQRIISLGEAVGTPFYLADARLHGAPLAGGAARMVPDPANPPMAEGVMLKLADISRDMADDPAAEQKVVLKIVVKGRPGAAIDPTRVVIRTYFYDLVDGKDVLLTNAQTAFAWRSPAPINWANDKSEVLETTYLRPKSAPPAAPAPATPAPVKSGKNRRGRAAVAEASPAPAATPVPVRTYAGYAVRVYYDRQLQDAQADPVRLMQQFPPPATLSDD